jgi:hypothetical protein
MIAWKPRSSSPIRLPAGTRQASKRSTALSDIPHAILSSTVRDNPGVSPLTNSGESPPAPGPQVSRDRL